MGRRPSSVHAEERKLPACPLTTVKPSEWRLVSLWAAWRRLGGMPGPGSVEEQEAKVVDAFGVLDFEQDLIQAYSSEVAERRARNG